MPGWSFSTDGPLPTPAVGPDGTVYLRNGDGTLLALNPDGRRRWTTDIGAPPARLGPVLWRANTDGAWATPAALDADGNAYVGAGSQLRSFAPDGSPRWSFAAQGEVGPPSLGSFGSVAFTARSADRVYLIGR